MTAYPLPAGVPTTRAYHQVLASDRFLDMERYSDRFLSRNEDALREYARRWVRDPIHQWSRQWEYPFVLDRLLPALKSGGGVSVLDAGSGVTFFPYYITSRFPGASVRCIDSDSQLRAIYQDIKSSEERRVEFECGDMRALPIRNGSFDAVYCISVLEHTSEYESIIAEFHRVLRPGGRLVVTFDLSLDGKREISLEAGDRLLSALKSRFDDVEGAVAAPLRQGLASDMFSTLTASQIGRGVLPWTRPSLARRVASRLARRSAPWPPPMTVFCVALNRAAAVP